MRTKRWHAATFLIASLAALAVITGCVTGPIILLAHADDRELNRWSAIGQALTPVGIFFSGVAFIGIALTLLLQARDLRNQNDVLDIAREDQRRATLIALRGLHTEIMKLSIDDPELRSVWPGISPDPKDERKDEYCNLILNLQRMFYELHIYTLDELRAMLRYLMKSEEIYRFWKNARETRLSIESGNEVADIFNAEVHAAFLAAERPMPKWGKAKASNARSRIGGRPKSVSSPPRLRRYRAGHQ